MSLGAGYVLSADLVREVAAGAALKPLRHQLFKLEDIAMGSWVQHIARERGVQARIQPARVLLVHHPGFLRHKSRPGY